MVEKPIRQWRVVEGQPSGCLVWFDPTTEIVRIYAKDSDLEMDSTHGLAVLGMTGYLDKVRSVSGSTPGGGGEEFKQEELVLEEDELPF